MPVCNVTRLIQSVLFVRQLILNSGRKQDSQGNSWRTRKYPDRPGRTGPEWTKIDPQEFGRTQKYTADMDETVPSVRVRSLQLSSKNEIICWCSYKFERKIEVRAEFEEKKIRKIVPWDLLGGIFLVTFRDS